jgi:transposase
VAIIPRHEVADFIRFRLHPHVEERSVRAYRGRLARVEQVRDTTVSVEVEEAAMEAAIRRLGWRLYGTHQAVLAYRNEYQGERSLGRLTGRRLSLTPMYVQRDDHATGLIRLWSIALRV